MRKLRPNNRGTDRVAERDFPAATRPSVNRTRDCLTSLIEDFYTESMNFFTKNIPHVTTSPDPNAPQRLCKSVNEKNKYSFGGCKTKKETLREITP